MIAHGFTRLILAWSGLGCVGAGALLAGEGGHCWCFVLWVGCCARYCKSDVGIVLMLRRSVLLFLEIIPQG